MRRPNPRDSSLSAALIVTILVVSNRVCADTPTDGNRFAINGVATLRVESIQQSKNFSLKAQLSPVQSPLSAPPPQRSDRFSLIAYADSVATACYNDTIFRDDFDGDGF